MSSKRLRITAAAVIGFAAGLLIAAAESSLGVSSGIYYVYGLLLLWPARLLISSVAASPVATCVAIVANALLYAAAAAVADRMTHWGQSQL